MDRVHGRNAKVLLERCESGRIGLTANELTWVTGSEGSNPSLSARGSGTWCRTARNNRPAPSGLPCTVTRRTGLVRGVSARRVGRYWLQTLGCPKNQVDSDKLEGYLEAQGYGRALDPDDRRPRRRQHLRLHRRRPPGVDRHRPGPGRGAAGRGAPRRDRLHGRALRRRAARRPPRGGPGGRVRPGPDRRAGRTGPRRPRHSRRRPHRVRSGRIPRLRPPRAAPSLCARTLGLRQGRRGV